MVNNEPAPVVVPSHLDSHKFSVDLTDTLYNFRVLRLNRSLFVYIGPAEQENFQEMAVSMPTGNGAECLTTTILGEQMNSSVIRSD